MNRMTDDNNNTIRNSRRNSNNNNNSPSTDRNSSSNSNNKDRIKNSCSSGVTIAASISGIGGISGGGIGCSSAVSGSTVPGTGCVKSERCVLCLDEKRSPVRIMCGHSFCTECLDVYKSYQKYAWANRCPICRGSLKEKRRSVKRKYREMDLSTATATATSTNAAARTRLSATVISSTAAAAATATTTSATIATATAIAAIATSFNATAATMEEATNEATAEQIFLLEEFMAIAAESDIVSNAGAIHVTSMATPTTTASTASASETADDDDDGDGNGIVGRIDDGDHVQAVHMPEDEEYFSDVDVDGENEVEEFDEEGGEEEEEEDVDDDVDVEDDEENDDDDDDNDVDRNGDDDDFYYFEDYDDEDDEDDDDDDEDNEDDAEHDYDEYETVDEDADGTSGATGDSFLQRTTVGEQVANEEIEGDYEEGDDDVLLVDDVIIVD